jgi:hypothetical protein
MHDSYKHRRRRPFGAVAAVTLAALLVAAPFSRAVTPTIDGFSVRPAHPNPSVSASGSYFVLHAKPAGSSHESVVVTNIGAKPLVLAVNAVDGLTGVTSGVVYSNSGAPIHAAGAWVTPAVRQVTVPAMSSVEVGFTVRVPSDARAGDHVAGIAFQALQKRSSSGAFSLTVVDRTVVGIEFVVPGLARPQIALSSLALAPLPGTDVPSAVVTLEDIGLALCQPRLSVTVIDGSAVYTAMQSLGTILPGDKIAYPFRLAGGLTGGSHHVSATASGCGASTTIHTVATYAPAAAAPKPPAASAKSGSSHTSNSEKGWAFVLLGLAAFTVTVARRRLLRRRRAAS